MRLIWLAVLAGSTLPAQRAWTPPRTPDGQPDIQGVWTNGTLTPMERPAGLAGKPFLTEAEAAELERKTAESRVDRPPPPGDPGGYNEFWWDRGSKVVATRRTSLILDPPEGRIPPLTPEAQKRAAERAAYNREHAFDGPESRSLQDRCLLFQTAGPPMLPAGYNNHYQIVQGPGYVAILVEMIHDVRIIPLDGRPHLPHNIRQWKGDSRGRWEGQTLVVETTNFSGNTSFRGSGPGLRLVERFSRPGQDTLLYEFTVDDPASFTRPWTAQLPMARASGPLYEYACHEGNYAMVNILGGARAAER
jgi:hypothetical protein